MAKRATAHAKPAKPSLSSETHADGTVPLGVHNPGRHTAVASTSPRAASALLLPSTFRTAFGALRRNKMRSALTALGVIIGVGAVIAMSEIGHGSKIALEKTIASMGANNLLVMPGWAVTGSVNLGSGTIQSLTPSDMNEIYRQCPAVGAAAPIVWARRN